MASDLKSDLVMTAFQRRPTVHLMGNPAVYLPISPERQIGRDATATPIAGVQTQYQNGPMGGSTILYWTLNSLPLVYRPWL